MIINFYQKVQLNQTNYFYSLQPMIQLGSSVVSSTIATVLLYPAQRIKIEMQLSISPKKNQNLKKQQYHQFDPQSEEFIANQQFQIKEGKDNTSLLLTSKNRSTSKLGKQNKIQTNTSISRVAKQIYKKNGWKGFYSGLQSLVIGNGLSYGVYFVVYQKCKLFLGFQPGSVLDTMKCSTIAGLVATLVTNPFWVLQTKQTAQNGSLIQKGKQLIRNQGFTSLWKGLSSSLILVTNPIIQFVIYEQLKKLTAVQKDSKLYDLVIFIIGAISKMISTLCTFPITVIRTKQHINTDKKKKWTQILKQIIESDGIKGLFKGLQPKLIQTVLNSALILMFFQRIRSILLKHFSP